jgi:hypothetical protein
MYVCGWGGGGWVGGENMTNSGKQNVLYDCRGRAGVRAGGWVCVCVCADILIFFSYFKLNLFNQYSHKNKTTSAFNK